MDEYIVGLRSRVAELEEECENLRKMSPNADQFERMKEINTEIGELQEQIDGLADSSEAIAEAGDNVVITIKE
ncbi:MAG: hypothetical protein AAB731_01940 [Patescibacteria group bacterium]